jgi:hypothetical protein
MSLHYSSCLLVAIPIGSIHPLDKSCTRTSFSEPRALSLLTLPHLHLVRFPLQIFLVPALHPIHLRFPALRRAWQDLALAVSSAIRDADRLGLGVGVSLRIGVVVCGRTEWNAGLGGGGSIWGASGWLLGCLCCHDYCLFCKRVEIGWFLLWFVTPGSR